MGRFFNVIGPFLAAMPVTTQITGVSDHSVLPTFRAARRRGPQQALLDLLERARRRRAAQHRATSRVYDSERGEEFTLDPARARPRRRLVRRPAARRRPRRHGQPLPRADRRRRPAGGDREHQAERRRAGHQRRGRRGLAGGAAARRRRDGERRAGEADRADAGSRRGRRGRAAQGRAARRRSSPSRLPAGPGWRCS